MPVVIFSGEEASKKCDAFEPLIVKPLSVFCPRPIDCYSSVWSPLVNAWLFSRYGGAVKMRALLASRRFNRIRQWFCTFTYNSESLPPAQREEFFISFMISFAPERRAKWVLPRQAYWVKCFEDELKFQPGKIWKIWERELYAFLPAFQTTQHRGARLPELCLLDKIQTLNIGLKLISNELVP